jgi:hypothetical protein
MALVAPWECLRRATGSPGGDGDGVHDGGDVFEVPLVVVAGSFAAGAERRRSIENVVRSSPSTATR